MQILCKYLFIAVSQPPTLLNSKHSRPRLSPQVMYFTGLFLAASFDGLRPLLVACHCQPFCSLANKLRSFVRTLKCPYTDVPPPALQCFCPWHFRIAAWKGDYYTKAMGEMYILVAWCTPLTSVYPVLLVLLSWWQINVLMMVLAVQFSSVHQPFLIPKLATCTMGVLLRWSLSFVILIDAVPYSLSLLHTGGPRATVRMPHGERGTRTYNW